MATQVTNKLISYKAAATLGAWRVIYLSAAYTVNYWATQTSNILGVTQDTADTNEAIPVHSESGLNSKVIASASITAGDLVSPVTDGSGLVQSVTPAETTTSSIPILGVAETGASANEIFEVKLGIQNPSIR